MRGSNRLAILSGIALLTCICGAAQAPPPSPVYTLAQLLSRIGVSEDGWDPSLLATTVTISIAKELNGKEAVAFGTETVGATPTRILHVAVRDPKSRRWVDHPVDLSSDQMFLLNIGSIQELRIEPNAVYVETHINPSWSNTAVLDKNWKLDYVIEGWIVGVLHNGSVIVQKGKPHFAPVHPLELANFDPESHSERVIYPPDPSGPVRAQFSKELQAAFDAIPRDWFRINNHPGNTEFISEYLRTVHIVTERNCDTVIVNSVFDGRQFDPVHRTNDPNRDIEILAVLRDVNHPKKTRYREFSLESLRQRIPFDSVDDLASSEMVDRIFDLPYP